MSFGMEVSGFTSFAGAYSLIPAHLTLHKCETLARDVLSRYPLLATSNTLNSSLLYPQFQLLLCFTAVEKYEARFRKSLNRDSGFARKKIDADAKPLQDLLSELIRDIGMDRSTNRLQDSSNIHMLDPDTTNPGNALPSSISGDRMSSSFAGSALSYPAGTIVLPSHDQPENLYTGTMDHTRHVQNMRMENLFHEIEAKVIDMLDTDSDVTAFIARQSDEVALDPKSRLTSKPVVIGDAVPVPEDCPESVEQLLQAALAHHNLGSFEEALHGYFTSEKADLEKSINDTGDWNDDIEKQFTEVVEQFKKTQTF